MKITIAIDGKFISYPITHGKDITLLVVTEVFKEFRCRGYGICHSYELVAAELGYTAQRVREIVCANTTKAERVNNAISNPIYAP